MKRVPVIGNSHVGAYKLAADLIAADHPDLRIEYFALPNARFYRSEIGEDMILRAGVQRPEDLESVIEINGFSEIDLSGCDTVLVAAQAFYLRAFLPLLAQFNILGLRSAGHERSISLAMLQDSMERRVHHAVERLEKFLRSDPRFVVVQTPFPTREIVEYEDDYAGLVRQPDLERITQFFNTCVKTAMAKTPLRYLPACDSLLSEPFFTDARYARARALPPGQPPNGGDFTHMNAEYAQAMFRRFAERFL